MEGTQDPDLVEVSAAHEHEKRKRAKTNTTASYETGAVDSMSKRTRRLRDASAAASSDGGANGDARNLCIPRHTATKHYRNSRIRHGMEDSEIIQRRQGDELDTSAALRSEQCTSGHASSNTEHWDNTFRRFSMLYQHNFQNKMRPPGDEEALHTDDQRKDTATIKHKPVQMMQPAQKRQRCEGDIKGTTRDRCNRCCW